MRRRNLVVDGSEDKEKVRELVAGLRLLKAYGKVAERALRDLQAGKDLSSYLPLVERRGRSSKGMYDLSVVPVHTPVPVPPLPDYSGFTFRLESHKDDSGHVVWARTLDAGLTVRSHGRVVRGALEGIIGSVRPVKNGFSWSFRGRGPSKRTLESINKGIAHHSAHVIVKLDSDGVGELWYSKAKQVHETLRLRAEAKLLLDGHAERLRKEVEASLTVDAVHAL